MSFDVHKKVPYSTIPIPTTTTYSILSDFEATFTTLIHRNFNLQTTRKPIRVLTHTKWGHFCLYTSPQLQNTRFWAILKQLLLPILPPSLPPSLPPFPDKHLYSRSNTIVLLRSTMTTTINICTVLVSLSFCSTSFHYTMTTTINICTVVVSLSFCSTSFHYTMTTTINICTVLVSLSFCFAPRWLRR